MRAVLGALVLVGLAGAPVLAQLADAPWPKFQHDAQNTGRSHLYDGPAGPNPQVAWEYRGKVGRTAVTIGNGGIIYVGDGKKPLTALSSADGSVLWSMTDGKVGQAARSTPAISDDGHVYIGERGNNLWSADALDGSIDWKFFVPSDGDIRVSPAIRSDGVIFMASGSLGAGFLYGINPNGTQKWLNPLGDFLSNLSPALSHDEQTLYVSSGATFVVALNAGTGVELWRKNVTKHGPGGGIANRSVVVGADGTLYFAGYEGVFAIDPDPMGTGQILHQFSPAGLFFQSAPALGADGTLYIGASGPVPTFYALNPDLSVKWSYIMLERGRFINTNAVVGLNGTVYVTFGHGLYSFTPGGVVNWRMGFSRKFTNGASIDDGALYVVNALTLHKVTD
jgi:outer membrane protein assembly factor BamB